MGDEKKGEKEAEVISDKVSKKLLDMSSVSLNLASYGDIFSSFDPRTYIQRTFSQDLLNEMKRATKELPSGELQITFIMPRARRNWEDEIVIKRRLREHFKRHYILSVHEMKKLKLRGYGMALLGVGFIFTSSLLYSIENAAFWIKFLQILLEPAGWFTAWTALEGVFYTGRELKEELDFHEKMSNANIEFLSY
ncbi:MAG: hypothetical protein AABX11_01995 [Nanoarchaeota archaeon]